MIINDNNFNKESIEQEDIELSLLETLVTYLRHWEKFALSIFICLVLAYAYIKLDTPVYKIESQLLIKDNKSNGGAQDDMLKDLGLFSSEKVIDNEIQILKSNTILEKAARALKLQTSYYVTARVRSKELYDELPYSVDLIKPTSLAYDVLLPFKLISTTQASYNGKTVSVGSPFQTPQGTVLITLTRNPQEFLGRLINVKFSTIDNVVGRYKSTLKVDPVTKQANVLNITIEDAVPKRGEAFLDKLVEEYNLASIEDKNQVTSNTLVFIDEELKRIADQLGSVEKNVEKYKSSNRITNISSESQIFLESVKDNDKELSKVNIQIDVLNNLDNYLKRQDKSQQLPSIVGIEDQNFAALVGKLSDALIRRQNALQTVPETNPMVVSLTEEVQSLKQSVYSSLQNLKRTLQITHDQLLLKNQRFEANIQQVPSKERGLLDVMRKQDIQNNLFTYLLQKREETAMSLASIVADSRIIDRANSSKIPVKPIKIVVFLSFFLLGIIIPAIVILIRSLLNFRITRRSDIERLTRTPIVGEISQSDSDESLLVSVKPRSMVAEQIRVLRTNLQFLIPDSNQKVILFTSSMSGEGKSFISLNLGGALAMAGKKVVILELDLRKPKLHAALSLDNTKGLSNYLIGQAKYDEIISEIPIQKNYYLIPSGPIPPNPAELLVNNRIGTLIEELKENFDYIIIDAPPVGLVTDAQILGAYADLTMFIVRHNYTAKNHIKAIDYYRFKNLHIILNSVDLQMGYGSSYGYGYGYGYGYSNGYYHADKKATLIERLFKW